MSLYSFSRRHIDTLQPVWYNRDMKNKINIFAEPEWKWDLETTPDDREWKWISAMHWYRVNATAKKNKAWVASYVKNNMDSDKQSNYKGASNKLYEDAGAICRILETGHPEDPILINRLGMKLRSIKDAVSRNSDNSKKAFQKSSNISIKDRMEDQLSEYMDVINSSIDIFASDSKILKKNWFSIGSWLTNNKVKSIQTIAISKEIKKVYNEVSAAYHKEDEQLVEAYSHMKKSHLHKFVQFLEIMIKELESHIQKVKPKKSSKKVNPQSMVKKLPHLKEIKEFGVKTVDPAKILGASAVVVYNSVSRLVYVYQSPPTNGGLSVQGAAITDFDASKSFMKKCRNPKHVVESTKRLNKKHTIDLIEKLNTVQKEVRPRLNKNCIILRVF